MFRRARRGFGDAHTRGVFRCPYRELIRRLAERCGIQDASRTWRGDDKTVHSLPARHTPNIDPQVHRTTRHVQGRQANALTCCRGIQSGEQWLPHQGNSNRRSHRCQGCRSCCWQSPAIRTLQASAFAARTPGQCRRPVPRTHGCCWHPDRSRALVRSARKLRKHDQIVCRHCEQLGGSRRGALVICGVTRKERRVAVSRERHVHKATRPEFG